jgi:hypothetical protein
MSGRNTEKFSDRLPADGKIIRRSFGERRGRKLNVATLKSRAGASKSAVILSGAARAAR